MFFRKSIERRLYIACRPHRDCHLVLAGGGIRTYSISEQISSTGCCWRHFQLAMCRTLCSLNAGAGFHAVVTTSPSFGRRPALIVLTKYVHCFHLHAVRKQSGSIAASLRCLMLVTNITRILLTSIQTLGAGIFVLRYDIIFHSEFLFLIRTTKNTRHYPFLWVGFRSSSAFAKIKKILCMSKLLTIWNYIQRHKYGDPGADLCVVIGFLDEQRFSGQKHHSEIQRALE